MMARLDFRGRRGARRAAWRDRIALVALLVGSALAGRPRPTAACDICAVYTAVELGRGRVGFRLGAAEQYTNFRTLKQGTDTVPNPGEKLDSSITQVFFGYKPRVRADEARAPGEPHSDLSS